MIHPRKYHPPRKPICTHVAIITKPCLGTGTYYIMDWYMLLLVGAHGCRLVQTTGYHVNVFVLFDTVWYRLIQLNSGYRLTQFGTVWCNDTVAYRNVKFGSV